MGYHIGTFWLFAVAAMELLAIQILVATEVARPKLSLQGCMEKCGGVIIPYPFGVGKGCYYNDGSDYDDSHYEIKCNTRHHPARPMFGNMQVLDISLQKGQMRVIKLAAHACYAKNGTLTRYYDPGLKLRKFTISSSENMFAAMGCDTYAWFEGKRWFDGKTYNKSYSTGCMTICNSPEDVANYTCSGLGCCKTAVPEGVTSLRLKANSFDNHTSVSSFNPCSFAFVAARDALNFSVANLSTVPHKIARLPVVFDWMVGTENCSTAQATGSYLCRGNSVCDDSKLNAGYRCKCLPGYMGNPYILDGCTDIDECSDPKLNQCDDRAFCRNTPGSYQCHCPRGFRGNGTKSNRCIADHSLTTFKIALGAAGGIIVLIVISSWMYWQHEKKKLLRARERCFRENGGHLLKQRLNGRDVPIDMVKIFTIEELDKATNKFSDSHIIGKGGFGAVYKGMLPNNQAVAIKKSLKADAKQSGQFINEVIVLSQLNNRNVVKLLGCCLETEVPLLVYEYIDNGTLHDHLHDEMKASLLTWDNRVRIASEVAEVLSYLHSTISTPIIHRDIKSMNILLDKNYTAKVADFGASRLVPMDQEHLATMVLGTYGYLDPEYLQTGELTQKSDAYSFGVVLVEILTGQEVVSNDRDERDRSLAIFFLRKMEEQCLHEILEDKIVRDEAIYDQVKGIADLAQSCLKLKGEERPTMKQVAMELQKIKEKIMRSVPWARSDNGLPGESPQLLGDFNYQSFSSLLASLECGR